MIKAELFERAQAILANATRHLTNDQMLERLKQVLKAHGALGSKAIRSSRGCPGTATYCACFGGLLRAYALLGYDSQEKAAALARRQRSMLLRGELIKTLIERFPDRLREIIPPAPHRSFLKDRRSGLLIEVRIAKTEP
jgi:hypothetical protein